MAAFKILPAALSDADDIVAIYFDAFGQDPINANLDKDVEPSLKLRLALEAYRKDFEHAHLTGIRFFKAVDTITGKTAGYAEWHVPVPPNPTQSALAAATTSKPPGTNISLITDFEGKWMLHKARWHNPATDHLLHILAVSPTYHRRGIGGLLLAEGIERADAAGARIYLQASKVGLPLYQRFGWEPVSEFVIDLEEHGVVGGGTCLEVCCIRSPKGGPRGGAVIA